MERGVHSTRQEDGGTRLRIEHSLIKDGDGAIKDQGMLAIKDQRALSDKRRPMERGQRSGSWEMDS